MANEATEHAYEVLARELLLQIVDNTDAHDFEWIRDEHFPNLEWGQFETVTLKLKGLVPPATWPKPNEARQAYLQLTNDDEEDEDW